MDPNPHTCPQCHIEYNQSTFAPRIFLTCGHTFCTFCLSRLLLNAPGEIKCPLDSSILTATSNSIDNFPISSTITNLLQERALSQEKCRIHDKKLNLICLVDKCKVCAYCLQYDSHKGHKGRLIKEVEADAESKARNLRGELNRLGKHYKQVEETMKDREEELVRLVKGSFKEVREALNNKESQLLGDISYFFANERKKVEDMMVKGYGYRNIIFEKIESLRNIFRDLKSYDALEEITTQQSFEQLNAVLTQYTNDMNKDLKMSSQTFSTTVNKQLLQLVGSLTFPADSISSSLDKATDKTNEIFKMNKVYLNNGVKTLTDMEYNDDRLILTPRNELMRTPRYVSHPMDKEDKEMMVNLDFAKVELSKLMLLELLHTINKLKGIPYIKMDFSQGNLQDNDLTSLCSSVLHANNKLETFEVWLTGCQLREKSISSMLSKMSKSLSGVRRVSLGLGRTSITNKTMEALGSGLSVISKSLEHLEVHVGSTSVTDEGISQLFVDSLKHLRSLVLNLEGTRVSDRSLDAFTKVLLPSMSMLEHLELGLCETEVTDEGVSRVVMGDAGNLRSLVLVLNGTKVSSEGMEKVIDDCLPKFRGLRRLEVMVDGRNVGERFMEVMRGGRGMLIERDSNR